MLLKFIIFITGGAILALELLASRIMMPYFGVSLYIWSGILSITLISLALGYWWGGRLTIKAANQQIHATQLTFLFAIMPAIAAIAIVLTCLIYPYLFYQLAQVDLVFGAFIACLMLLFIPLLTTSAMNPLLVALLLHQTAPNPKTASDTAKDTSIDTSKDTLIDNLNQNTATDAGAGYVFFVSTIGSVAGVIVTAFWMIPTFSNFVSVLLVAITLAVLPVAIIYNPAYKVTNRYHLIIVTNIALVASIGLFLGSDLYIKQIWSRSKSLTWWRPEAVYRSMFGTVQILRNESPSQDIRYLYFQDGLTQNIADAKHRSFTFYTYALENLAYAYIPSMQKALVLGNGAGIVPMSFAKRGIAVTTVEINPAAIQAAQDFFGFDPQQVRTIQADARTYLQQCHDEYTTVVVDLFHGDGTPEYLITREMFRDLKHCLTKNGIAVFNTFANLEQPRFYAHFLTTLQAELPYIVVYRKPSTEKHINSFVVASLNPLPKPIIPRYLNIPIPQYKQDMMVMLKTPQPINQKLLTGGKIITDANNPATYDIAKNQLLYRHSMLKQIPAALFVN